MLPHPHTSHTLAIHAGIRGQTTSDAIHVFPSDSSGLGDEEDEEDEEEDEGVRDVESPRVISAIWTRRSRPPLLPRRVCCARRNA